MHRRSVRDRIVALRLVIRLLFEVDVECFCSTGDLFLCVESEKQARDIAEEREQKEREERVSSRRAVQLDDPFAMLAGYGQAMRSAVYDFYKSEFLY